MKHFKILILVLLTVVLFSLLVFLKIDLKMTKHEKIVDKTGNFYVQDYSSSNVPTKIEKEIIANIRIQFSNINNSSNKYRKVSKILLEYDDGRQILDAYFEREKIRKIIIKGYFPLVKAVEEYYFWQSGLIFVFEKKEIYNFIGPDFIDRELIRIEENRYYFHKNKLIRWIDENNRHTSSNDPQFAEEQNRILNESRSYIKEVQ